MLPEERKEHILDLLASNKYTSISELCATLHFSESTVRRDLKKLSQDHLIAYTRGGVIAQLHQNMEIPLPLRQSTNRDVKRLIAQRAAQLVMDNQMILLDASTTVLEMIPYLACKRGLTIVTPCLSTAAKISQTLDCTLLCTGGKYHKQSMSLIGPTAESTLKKWFVDTMFFSTSGIDAVNGLTDRGEEVSQLKITMLRQARQAVLLSDSSKFGKTAAYKITPIDVSAIITNFSPLFEQDCWQPYRDKIIFADR